MSAPKSVMELVHRFREQQDTYITTKYNEAHVRREFIDPFFKILGWDIDNTQGFAETYKDVIHEDAIKISGDHRAPDYSFRIGGTRKFFLEAKKPSISINEDQESAYQIRRYGWSAKLDLSIITSFREFAVYDCRVQPHKSDAAAVARIMYLTFDQYDSRWQDISSVFAKDAVYKGSFDKFAESTKQKRGTAQVDDAFLAEIEFGAMLLRGT